MAFEGTWPAPYKKVSCPNDDHCVITIKNCARWWGSEIVRRWVLSTIHSRHEALSNTWWMSRSPRGDTMQCIESLTRIRSAPMLSLAIRNFFHMNNCFVLWCFQNFQYILEARRVHQIDSFQFAPICQLIASLRQHILIFVKMMAWKASVWRLVYNAQVSGPVAYSERFPLPSNHCMHLRSRTSRERIMQRESGKQPWQKMITSKKNLMAFLELPKNDYAKKTTDGPQISICKNTRTSHVFS